MTIEIEDNIRLELIAPMHAQGLFEATDNNRDHLSAFLPWVKHMQSVTNFSDYISHCESLYNQKKEVSFVIIYEEVVVGRIGLHNIDMQHKNASLGYWLTKDAEGKGIISKGCKSLINYAFDQIGVHRIEIKAAADNIRSRAIAEKLQFKKEGILREAEWVNKKFIDMALYSLLDEEWISNK